MKNEIRLMPDDAFAPWYCTCFSKQDLGNPLGDHHFYMHRIRGMPHFQTQQGSQSLGVGSSRRDGHGACPLRENDQRPIWSNMNIV